MADGKVECQGAATAPAVVEAPQTHGRGRIGRGGGRQEQRGGDQQGGQEERMKRIAAAAAVLLAVLGVLTAGCGGAPEFMPAGEVPAAPEEFRWPAWDGAEEYELKIYTTDQQVLHESGRLRASRLEVKAGLRKKLEDAGEFEWWIRVYERGRVAGRSDPVAVRIVSGA